MSMNDPLADLLTRLRNASRAGHATAHVADDHLQRAVVRQIALDGEHVHFAERRGNRRQTARGLRRQIFHYVTQPFGHLLARPIEVGTVLEIEGHVGQRIFGDGA